MTNSRSEELLIDLVESNRKFLEVCATCYDLFSTKNEQYANAIEQTGLLGAVVEIIGAAARLRPMVLWEKLPLSLNQQAKLTDVLKDLHNYSAIALIMLEKENWSGE